MRIAYRNHDFSPAVQAVIDQADVICREYRAQGYDLTLRQLYYQFVARALIPNKDSEYKRLGSIVNDARMAGRLDWNYIVDRTRNLRSFYGWDNPGQIIESAADGYRVKRWENQPYSIEVWVEKEALVGVVDRACEDLDVPYFSCRGYVSQSEMWSAGQRIGRNLKDGKKVVVLHLGDHDPSGIDMSRDIEDRLRRFVLTDHARSGDGSFSSLRRVEDFEVRRIALNMDQVEEFDPPPNPAKLTDARARGYIEEYGDESWELDALEPQYMVDLIQGHVLAMRDDEVYEADLAREEEGRGILRRFVDTWDQQ